MSKNLCEVCGHNVQIEDMLECQECLDRMAYDYDEEDWYQQMGADKPSGPETEIKLNPEDYTIERAIQDLLNGNTF